MTFDCQQKRHYCLAWKRLDSGRRDQTVQYGTAAPPRLSLQQPGSALFVAVVLALSSAGLLANRP
jgi:hypothetical protein